MRTVLLVAAAVVAVGGILAVVFVWSFRTGFRPVLTAVRRMNRRFTNPQQLRTAGQPGAHASVVHHVGRRSGTTYRTPVVAVPTDDGFVVALPYGSRADWVRNVLAAGRTTLAHQGEVVELVHPSVVGPDRAAHHFDARERRSQRLYGLVDFLLLQRPPAPLQAPDA